MIHRKDLHFWGLEDKALFEDDLARSHVRDVQQDVAQNGFVAVSGAWGSGKTTLFRHVLASLGAEDPYAASAPIVIRVASEEKERLKIGHIITAIILGIGEATGKHESPRRDMEARCIQMRRMLGEASVRDRRIVRRILVWIDNAHRLHAQTIRAIKDLMEVDYCGVSPLFSVALIGQQDLATKIRHYGEVRCRVSMYELDEDSGWLARSRREQYLKARYCGLLPAGAVIRIAARATTYLGMDDLVDTVLARQARAGIQSLSEDLWEPSLGDLYQMLHDNYSVGLREIGKQAGISAATVSSVLHGNNTRTDNITAVKRAMRQIETDRTEGSAGEAACG